MQSIPLTQGKVALVDDEDFERVSEFNWHVWRHPKNKRYYACRNVWLGDGKGTIQSMHRFILNLDQSDSIEVDHIAFGPESGLNNQRSNLRLATSGQNQHNRGKSKNNQSGWKGVSFDRRRGRWMTTIKYQGKTIHGGRFNTSVEAAAVYNFLALRFHGAFACLNDLSTVI